MNLKLQNLDHVKILAKIEAQITGEDQAVVNAIRGTYRIFDFRSARKFKGDTVAIVRYTPEVKRRNVLPDNGIGEPVAVDSTTNKEGQINSSDMDENTGDRIKEKAANSNSKKAGKAERKAE